ncbi:hypothetical protein B0T24DRAFT_666787 [Lasiosphaeria ovina]|uniref:F-box domain-containing protein n=1 Tax=Lasiosphaeria ovina TaxID=92902 RepID=A0AAE0KB90_9PEZI|nr:hypothetical protein B0T24DRAFT_666787 [Lasiosphaeria ovina]
MGHLFSNLVWRRRAPYVPPLLNLPVEIVLCIADHLASSAAPEGTLALSLTCRCLFRILRADTAKLLLGSNDHGQQCRSSLLLLLGRDLGERFFSCARCCRLHSFSPRWAPWVPGEGSPECEQQWRFLHDARHSPPLLEDAKHAAWLLFFSPGTSEYKISFAHVRLVTNRHLYGAPKGLPLENLDLESKGVVGWASSLGGIHYWQQRSCLRKALDEGRRNRVCTHVMPGRVEFYEHRHGLRRVLALAAGPGEDDGLDKRPAWDRPPRNEAEKRAGARSALRPCRDEPGSCTICLTDYTTTVERGQQARETWRHDSGQIVYEPAVEGWRVTTTAYHGVGACRDVQDWRWVALCGSEPPESRGFSPWPGEGEVAGCITLVYNQGLSATALVVQKSWVGVIIRNMNAREWSELELES